jgi:hypothetical protein
MTPTEEKQIQVKKLGQFVGREHEEQFNRLPLKTLKALVGKFASVAPAPAPVGG